VDRRGFGGGREGGRSEEEAGKREEKEEATPLAIYAWLNVG